MPRLARLDAPGVLHHIMIRGIERRKIFRDNKDREDFLDRLCILGDSDFVDSVLLQASEKYERRYELKRLGYDLKRIARRVAEIYAIEEGEVFSRGRQQHKVKARSLLCYWAVRELGISLTNLAEHLEMSVPWIGFAVERGETIVKDKNYHLIE